MIIWIDGPYGVGKSTLAEKLHEINRHSFVFDAEAVGNAVRDNLPEELFNGYIFEGYPMWFSLCTELLADLAGRYEGDIYVPMTLVWPDSYAKIKRPLAEQGIAIRHVLLEAPHTVIRDRILARGEEEDCWCMRHIDLCLENQKRFSDVLRIAAYGKTPAELALELTHALQETDRISP